MLLRQDERDRIARGAQSVVFRRWVRPTVRAGGTLKTPSGVVGIDAVEAIDERDLGDARTVRIVIPYDDAQGARVFIEE